MARIRSATGKAREQSDMDGYLVATLKNRAGDRWTDLEEFSGNYFLRRIKQWWNRRSLEGVSSYLAKEQKLGYSGKEAPFSCFAVSRKMVQSEAESPPYNSIFSEFSTVFFVLFPVSFHFHGQIYWSELGCHFKCNQGWHTTDVCVCVCVCVLGDHDLHANSIIIKLMVACFTTHRHYTHNGTSKLS